MTPFQLEESANAPWTSTTVGLGPVGWCPVRQCAVVRRRTDQIFQRVRSVPDVRCGADRDELGGVTSWGERFEPREAFTVDDGDRGVRIAQAVSEIISGSPGIERDRDSADGCCGPECDRPFWIISHGDRYAIALLHAVIVSQAPGER